MIENNTLALRIQRLFRGTVSPPDKLIVTQYLKDTEKEIKDCQTEISRLKAMIRTLETKGRGLKKKAERYRSLLAPVNRLPPEIMTYIFDLCCEENSLTRETLPPVMLVAEVCGRWRDIVLSTPRLWSRFSITFQRWQSKSSKLNKLSGLFLGRSRNSPLTIKLNFSGISEDRDIGRAKPILKNIACHSDRLSVHSRQTADAQESDVLWTTPLDIFEQCPSLRTLDFDTQFPGTFILPWHQIKALEIQSCFMEPAIPILSSCANVDSIVLHCVGGGHYEAKDNMVSSIQSLTIMADNQQDISPIFECATLPHLLSLDIRGLQKEAPGSSWQLFDDTGILDCMKRSSCSITSLRLDWLPIKEEQLVDILALMPSIGDLYLRRYYSPEEPDCKMFSSAFFMRLMIDHERSTNMKALFLPRLVGLTVVGLFSSSEEQVLLEAIVSRWLPKRAQVSKVGIDSLKSVTVNTINRLLYTQTMDSLKCLIDAGLLFTNDTEIYLGSEPEYEV
ncbi:hypothetical protein VNI00_008755 [Paramarasmius palmivorus]|uniref:F-box domain-containing protein n=1 Tax=Paramarasmius palmivorus TaxID=297713 RepID=A0AAW0CW10_9AGAR